MRVIVAGTRSVTEYDIVCWAIWESGFPVDLVVSGCAPGVDSLGIRWALERNIPVLRGPANWAKHRKAAGFIRNQEMAREADALVAVWDGQSRGTAHMIAVMRRLKKPVHVVMTTDWAPCDIRGWTSGMPPREPSIG